MLESSMTLMGLNYYNFLATGHVASRVGPNPLATVGSAGTFVTEDGKYLMVNANSHRLFKRLATAVDRPDLLSDARFSTKEAAHKNRRELREIFAEIFSTRNAVHWDRLLGKAGVPVGKAKLPDEVLHNPQLAHRKSLTRLNDVPGMPNGLTFLNAGFTVNNSPTSPQRPPPRLGEHSTEILIELGFEQTEIKDLQRKKVIT
jgi:crotonobetainyl-CoA:carnitine CoA-transferase CaiB-like acyl-CoA transferase